MTKLSHPPIRAFNAVHDLMRAPDRARNAAWWSAIRQGRDSVLEVLHGPPDPIVFAILMQDAAVPGWLRNDPEWRASVWRAALAEMEAWSERLDAAYVRFAAEQPYAQVGTA